MGSRSSSALDLVIGLITVKGSLPIIPLNAPVILAIKQRKKLQKPSNIVLSSLAFTDLLLGVIIMPTSATIDFFTLRQVPFEYTCKLYSVNLFFLPLLFVATMHHLTIIAWERYVAVQKCMDGLQAYHHKWPPKKIAIAIWLSALFLTVANFITTVVVVDGRILDGFFKAWTALEISCLVLIAFF